MITRRELLSSSIATAGVGAFAPSWLRQDPLAASAGPAEGRILVVVQLSGGNDGLNTVVPHGDDRYHAARPTLRIAPDKMLKIDEHVGLHPALAALRARYDQGQVAIVQGVGYPTPNRSHFRSMDIWHSADPDGPPRSGWLGRFADSIANSGKANDEVVGVLEASSPALATSSGGALLVQLGSAVPLALRRAQAPIVALDNEDSFALSPDRKYPADRAEQDKAFRALCPPAALPVERASATDRVRATAAAGLAQADQVAACLAKSANQVSYPKSLGTRLALAARLIAGGLGARVLYTALGGFDTHARQRDGHATQLQNLSDSIDAFYQDLARLGRERDVVVLVFSEFGRRVAENASAGTDHGAAAPVFVIGPQVHGGLYGPLPDLEHLVDGDLALGVDFRSVYATLLKGWLGSPPEGIVSGEFPLVPFLTLA